MLLMRRSYASFPLTSLSHHHHLLLRSTASFSSLSHSILPSSTSLFSPSSILSSPLPSPSSSPSSSSFLKPTWSSLSSSSLSFSSSSSSSSSPFPLHQQLRHYSSSPSQGEKEDGKDKKKEKELSDLTDEEASKLGLTDRAKYLTKKYGWVALGTYSTVYVTFFTSIALAIQLGVDVQGVIGMLGLTKWIGPESLDPRAGVLVMAFVLNKFTSPIRIVIVASITPYVARILKAFRAKQG